MDCEKLNQRNNLIFSSYSHSALRLSAGHFLRTHRSLITTLSINAMMSLVTMMTMITMIPERPHKDKYFPLFQFSLAVDGCLYRLTHLVRLTRQWPCLVVGHDLLPDVESVHRPPPRLPL